MTVVGASSGGHLSFGFFGTRDTLFAFELASCFAISLQGLSITCEGTAQSEVALLSDLVDAPFWKTRRP